MHDHRLKVDKVVVKKLIKKGNICLAEVESISSGKTFYCYASNSIEAFLDENVVLWGVLGQETGYLCVKDPVGTYSELKYDPHYIVEVNEGGGYARMVVPAAGVDEKIPLDGVDREEIEKAKSVIENCGIYCIGYFKSEKKNGSSSRS